jgi:sigma-B regulation protein RsbU (phosphoserine phosphatase)
MGATAIQVALEESICMSQQQAGFAFVMLGTIFLLLSRGGTLHRIESNGLVFGVTPQPDYPVQDISICPGDRFLLYTDGVIEPENAKGKAFGDSKLEEVVLDNRMHSPSDLADKLLTEIRSWQPASMNQQDDITLVVIDVGADPD